MTNNFKPLCVFLKQTLSCCLLLFLGRQTVCSQSSLPAATISTDTLIEKYLSNTDHAAQKIIELIAKARKQKNEGDKIDAIRTFQVALSLAPYAGDSFELLSKLHSEFAGLLHDAKAEELSLKYTKSALTYERRAHTKASSRAYNLIGGVAGYYLRTEQFDSALYYFRLQSIEAYGTHISLWTAGAYNNTGVLFLKKGEPGSARIYLDSARSSLIMRDHGDSVLLSSITDNLAQMALKEKDFKGSQNFYHSNLRYYTSMKDSNGTIKTLQGLMTVALEEHKMSDAAELMNQIGRFPGIRNGKYGANFTVGWFELVKKYYSATGNWKGISEAQAGLSSFKDSLNTVAAKEQNELTNSITASEMYRVNTDLNLFQLQLQQREKDLKYTRLGLFAALLLILLSIGLLVLLLTWFRNRSRIQQHEIEIQTVAKKLAEANLRNQQLEQEQIQRELDFKKKDLSDLALYVAKLKDMYDLMVVKLNQIKRKRNADHKQELSDLATEIDALVQSQEKVSLIQENVGQINKEFSDTLLQKFPTLTKSEVELCGLFRLNMSNKEIGALKGISAESVKMSRYRLRKKLGLAPEEDIYRFLSSI